MKALVKTAEGDGHVELIEVTRRDPGPGMVEVEIKNAAICGTDLQIWHGTHKTFPPVVLGHECSGVVARVGDGVDTWVPGDRVTLETAAEVCGRCLYCRTGNYPLCIRRRGLGTRRDGAFARYCTIRADALHRLPQTVTFQAGALSNPFSIGHKAISQGALTAGDVVVISGSGGIGLVLVQLAKLEGATVILLGLERDRHRLKTGAALGADVVVNVERQEALSVVQDLTEGYGADVVFECAGVPASIDQCLRLVRKRGRFIQVGVFSGSELVEFGQIASKELTVIGSYGHDGVTMDRVNRLLGEGKLNGDALVSDDLPLTEWRRGFEMMEQGIGLRILLHPDD